MFSYYLWGIDSMKNNSKKRIAIIMAGGSGERLWPLSLQNKPKQFSKFADGSITLFDQTVSNISLLFPQNDIFIATSIQFSADIIKNLTGILKENIIQEPFKRNTSGCLALAAAELKSRYGCDSDNITMGVFPTDHSITNTDNFRIMVNAALSTAEKKDAIVTLGIKPTRPATGYGYIKIKDEPEFNIDSIPVYNVDRFCEKPDLKTAKAYISTGQFYWNSGMFFWRLSTFLDELKAASPRLSTAVENMTEAISSVDKKRLKTIFKGLDDISIDYTLMEKANRVFALKADFGWEDVGTWDTLERLLPQDENGNVTVGDPIIIDSQNCIVYNDSGSEKGSIKIPVGVIGAEELVIIVSNNGVLVVPKDRAQDVKKVVSELKKRNSKPL